MRVSSLRILHKAFGKESENDGSRRVENDEKRPSTYRARLWSHCSGLGGFLKEAQVSSCAFRECFAVEIFRQVEVTVESRQEARAIFCSNIWLRLALLHLGVTRFIYCNLVGESISDCPLLCMYQALATSHFEIHIRSSIPT